jgi:hypothetical protein
MTSNILDEVLAAPEAEHLWGLSAGTVRAACGRGIIVCRKSAGTWLVTRQAMEAHYGKCPDKEPIDQTPGTEPDNK